MPRDLYELLNAQGCVRQGQRNGRRLTQVGDSSRSQGPCGLTASVALWSHGHMRSTIDWIVIIAIAAVTAAVARSALPFWANAEGGFGPTLINAQQVGPAVAAVGVVLVIMFLLSFSAAAFIGPMAAMAAVGAGLGWGALGLDGMRGVLITGDTGAAYGEGCLWAILVLLLSWVLIVHRGGVKTVEPDPSGACPDPMVSVEAIRAAVIGIVAGLLAAWLVTRTDIRQQTAVAAAVGGLACGFAGRLASPHVQPVLLPPALVLGGTLAAWIAFIFVPDDVEGALEVGNVPALLLPLPIDWAAGALLGVPLGFAAAHGFLHHDDEGNHAPSPT